MYFFSSSLELSVSWYIHNSISLHIYYQEPVPRYNVTLPPSIADVSKRKWVGGGGYIILKAVKRTGWITPYQSFVPTHPVHLKWCGRKTTVCLLDQRGVEVQIRIEILSRGYLWPWDTFVFEPPMLWAFFANELPALLSCICFQLPIFIFSYTYAFSYLCIWATYASEMLMLRAAMLMTNVCLQTTLLASNPCLRATYAFGLPLHSSFLCFLATYAFEQPMILSYLFQCL